MVRQLPLPLAFNPEHGFEEYYAGGNAEVVGHLRQAAHAQGEPLIYVWGKPGLGKTHLLHACCREAHLNGLIVSYVPLNALRQYGGAVLDGLEEQDFVCLDDLDAIEGDEAWERALFDLFNRLRDAGHCLIIAGQKPPSELAIALPDLKTRLNWGLTLCLRDFSDDDKLAALSLRARLLGLELPPPVGRFLLSHCRRDLADLMELLERLDLATLAAKRKLTVPFLKTFLAENP